MMIEVRIDSVRISLMTQNRVVVLREIDSRRYLPIWIGAPEADAITLKLQNIKVERPLTHDLLLNALTTLDATVESVVIKELKDDIYFAEIILHRQGLKIGLDARPSDAIALAVRAGVPIYVDEAVLDAVGRMPEEDITASILAETGQEEISGKETDIEIEDLGAFADFIEGLNLDDLSQS